MINPNTKKEFETIDIDQLEWESEKLKEVAIELLKNDYKLIVGIPTVKFQEKTNYFNFTKDEIHFGYIQKEKYKPFELATVHQGSKEHGTGTLLFETYDIELKHFEKTLEETKKELKRYNLKPTDNLTFAILNYKEIILETKKFAYSYPKLNEIDLREAEEYKLKSIYEKEYTTVVIGTKGNHKKFAEEYLGYILIEELFFEPIKEEKDLNDYKDLIIKWASERNLLTADPQKQFNKLIEEVGELAEAMLNNDKKELIDAVGDIFVVLTIFSEQNKFSITEAIKAAYQEIKDRNGVLINGVYVREKQ